MKNTQIHLNKQQLELVRAELAEDTDPPTGTADKTVHRTQAKGEDAGDASDDDPDPPPTQRSLYDSLCGIFQRFPYLATFRTPRPTSKTDPRHDPEAQQRLEREIALSLAAEDISCVVASAFSTVNGQSTAPHVHAALSKPPSFAWSKAYRAEFGDRAVDVRPLGSSELDPQRVARYMAAQTVSITAAAPRPTGRPFVRSVALDEAGELFSEPKPEGNESKGDFSADAVLVPASLGEVFAPVALAPIDFEKVARFNAWARSVIEEQRARPPPKASR